MIGEDVLVPGDFTVTLPAEGAALNALFANPAAATAAEVVAWLNGNKATFTYNERDFLFSDRAIAYVEGGKISIRTRAVGTFNPTIQIPERISTSSADSLNEYLFTDHAVKVAAASRADVRKRASAANDDPKAVRTAANIKYTLDPVDDLVPGTYMINVEFMGAREQQLRRAGILRDAIRQGGNLPGQAGGRGEADGRQLHLLSLEQVPA